MMSASRSPVLRIFRVFGVVLLVVLVAQLVPAQAQAAGDYTQGVTQLDSADADIWFTPTTPSALVDVHYLIAGTPQQNFRMTNNNGTWQHAVGQLTGGTLIEYWFTYEKNGPLNDTPHFTYTQGGSGGGGGNGTFSVVFQNNTQGMWSASQIYVLVLGMATPGQWSYLLPNGTMTHINHLDANAPGHLTKNGVNYANMSFTLAQAATVTIPTHVEGGRVYISVGSPIYIPIAPDDSGWGGPDLHNPGDPNANVYFDWYEFTYGYGTIAFGGNTTQVDMFGFPLTARLQQNAIGYDKSVGITLSRSQVFSQYASSVGPAFQPLAGTYRIVAPRSSASFEPGGTQANYLQAYLDQTWNEYTANQFTLTRLNQTFTGRVVNGQLQFTKDGAGPFVLNKPTTADVLQCSGALASAGMTTTALELGAEFCAAFNRGVATNTANWYNPATYYTGAIKNDYAQFFHAVSIAHRAYGFAYDDINDQSSVQILPNTNPPSSLTIGVGW